MYSRSGLLQYTRLYGSFGNQVRLYNILYALPIQSATFCVAFSVSKLVAHASRPVIQLYLARIACSTVSSSATVELPHTGSRQLAKSSVRGDVTSLLSELLTAQVVAL